MAQNKNVSLEVILSKSSKKILDAFVKKRGAQAHRVFEQALIGCLEDEMDKSIIKERSRDATTPWKNLKKQA